MRGRQLFDNLPARARARNFRPRQLNCIFSVVVMVPPLRVRRSELPPRPRRRPRFVIVEFERQASAIVCQFAEFALDCAALALMTVHKSDSNVFLKFACAKGP